MSNPEKAKMDSEEEINENYDGSDYIWSDEEGEVRELVLALPALSVSERLNAAEVNRNEAVVAAQLLLLSAQEAAVTIEQGVEGGSENVQKTTLGRRPRKDKLDDAVAAAGASGSTAIGSAGEEEPAKKPKKKGSSKLNHPPQGPPQCNICRRKFVSWKAVFGHLRAHKDRGYQGFLPPPTFNAAGEGFVGAVAASSGGGEFGFGTGGLAIDLNADPMEEEEEEIVTESTPKFDLNRSPPQDDEEQKEEKAE